jgi:lipopolysaccharide/colanic/teichoic acid biosynthesis glycosyltransferase
MREPFLKRPFDFLLSLHRHYFFFPPVDTVWSVDLLEDGWPVLYFHGRVGKGGETRELAILLYT